jgi:hypothetical protein
MKCEPVIYVPAVTIAVPLYLCSPIAGFIALFSAAIGNANGNGFLVCIVISTRIIDANMKINCQNTLITLSVKYAKHVFWATSFPKLVLENLMITRVLRNSQDTENSQSVNFP